MKMLLYLLIFVHFGDAENNVEIEKGITTVHPRACSLQKRCILPNGAEVWFNPAYQICCGGEVHRTANFPMPWRVGCCKEERRYRRNNVLPSAEIYDMTKSICCGGRVLRIADFSGQVECCNGLIHHVTKGICCQGVWQKYPVSMDQQTRNKMACCGKGRFYNIKTERCCTSDSYYNRVRVIPYQDDLDCCSSHYFNTTTHRCHKGIVESVSEFYLEKCGNMDFDTRKKNCCDGVLHDQSQVCCNGRLHKKSKRKKCCSQSYIYPARQVCCGGQVYNRFAGLCCRDRWNELSVGQDLKKQKCCGDRAIHRYDQRCCNGIILTSSTGECCGTRTITPTELCCDENYIIGKSQPTDSGCCISPARDRYIPYDNSKQECTSSGVISKNRPWHQQPCGRDGAYDILSSTCCDGVITVGIPQSSSKCCRGQAYRITDKSPCDKIFCDGQIYSAKIYKCCRGKPFLGRRCPRVCDTFCRRHNLKGWKSYVCNMTQVFTGYVVKVKQKNHRTTLQVDILDTTNQTADSSSKVVVKQLTVYFNGTCKKCITNVYNKNIIILTNIPFNKKLRLTKKDVLSVVKNTKFLKRMKKYRQKHC